MIHRLQKLAMAQRSESERALTYVAQFGTKRPLEHDVSTKRARLDQDEWYELVRSSPDDLELVKAAITSTGSSGPFFLASERLRNHVQLAEHAIKIGRNDRVISYAGDNVKNSPEVVELALNVTRKPDAFFEAGADVRNDPAVARLAIILSKKGHAFSAAGEDVKQNKEIITLAVRKHWIRIHDADERYKDDIDIMKIVIGREGRLLKEAGDNVKNNRDIVKSAVNQLGFFLKYASDDLKDDREVVELAVKTYGDALRFASDRLRNDPSIVKLAVKLHKPALRFAGPIAVTEIVRDDGAMLIWASAEHRGIARIALEAIRQSSEATRWVSPHVFESERFRLLVGMIEAQRAQRTVDRIETLEKKLDLALHRAGVSRRTL